MEIRSYRRVFDLERRIYRVDRLRLNPGGVPVRGVIYFLGILVAALISGRLPLVAVPAGMLPWYVRFLALPVLSAGVLTMIRIEGRPFHLAAYALVRYRAAPRRLAGVCRRGSPHGRWHPAEIVLLPDGSDSTMRRMHYTGPGALLVAVEAECSGRASGQRSLRFRARGLRAELILRALPGGRVLSRGKVIALSPGARLLVSSDLAQRG